MAYVFNFNSNNLAGKEDEEPGVVQKSQLLPQSGGVSVKTSQPAVKAATPAQQTASATPSMGMPQAQAGHNDAVPRSINTIGNNLTKTSQDMQTKANSFLDSTRKSNDYGVTTSDLNMVAKGDPTASTKISGILSKKVPSSVGQFDVGYKPPEGLDNLGTEAGLAHVAHAGQNSEFTPGEAAFDAGQISRDPAFQKAYKELRGREKDLRQTSQKTQDETQKAAQGIADAELANTQKNIRDWLKNEMGNMTAGNDLEADQANAGLNNLDLNKIAAGMAPEQIQAVKDAAIAKLGPRGSKQVDDAIAGITSGNMGDYISRHGDYKRSDFINNDEASAYNAMLNMLGEGGDSWSAAGDLGPQYTFQGDKFGNDVYGNALNARMGLDTTNEAERQKLLGNVQGFVDEGNRGLQNQVSGYRDTLGGIAQGYLGEHGDLSSFYDPNMIDQYMGNNPLSYDPYTVENYMPEAEAGALNDLSKDLGLPANYQRGQRALGDGGPEDIINDDRFKEWLGSQLNPKKASRDAEEAAKAKQAADAQAADTAFSNSGGYQETSPGSGDFRDYDDKPYIAPNGSGNMGSTWDNITKLVTADAGHGGTPTPLQDLGEGLKKGGKKLAKWVGR